MTMFWKKLNFDLWTLSRRGGGGEDLLTPRARGDVGVCGQIFATMLLHSWFPLIWYATWPCSEIVEFWPFDPRVRGMGGGGGLQQNFVIPFNVICNMTMFWKNNILPTDPIPRVRSAAKIYATRLLHFLIPFNLICNMTLFWKVELWPFDPRLGGSAGKIFATKLLHFLIIFNLICNMTMFWNSGMGLRYGGGGGGGSAAKFRDSL